MTRSEKKGSYSEIIYFNKNAAYNIDCKMTFYTLDSETTCSIIAPYDGFCNILPYNETIDFSVSIDAHEYIIDSEQCHLFPLNEGDLININKSQKCILIFLPTTLSKFIKHDFDSIFDSVNIIQKNSKIDFLLQQITDLNISYDLDKLRIYNMLLEIFISQIESVSTNLENKQTPLLKDHYEKISHAKRLIEKDLSKNYTITELAKIVGTNEQYLKKFFKQYNGKTISTFTTQLKMEYARQLILSGGYRITDVSRLTGYKHATHFTSAFKKYFGFIPNSLKY